MAEDRADPLSDAEAEDHIMGVINGDIAYVPDEEDYQEDDVSSFLNLDGATDIVDDQEGEGRRKSGDEGTDIVDGGEPSTNDDLKFQVATTSGKIYIYIEPLVIQTY